MADEVKVDDVATDAGDNVLGNTNRQEVVEADGVQQQLAQDGHGQDITLIEPGGGNNFSVFNNNDQPLYRLNWTQPVFSINQDHIVMRYGDGKKRKIIISEAVAYAGKFSKLFDYMDEVGLIEKSETLLALIEQRKQRLAENVRNADADGTRCKVRKWYDIITKDIEKAFELQEVAIKDDYHRVSAIITENALRIEESEIGIDNLRSDLRERIDEIRFEVREETANRMNVTDILQRLEDIETRIENRLLIRQVEVLNVVKEANEKCVKSRLD